MSRRLASLARSEQEALLYLILAAIAVLGGLAGGLAAVS